MDVKDNDVWCVLLRDLLSVCVPATLKRALAALMLATREVTAPRLQVARRGDHCGA